MHSILNAVLNVGHKESNRHLGPVFFWGGAFLIFCINTEYLDEDLVPYIHRYMMTKGMSLLAVEPSPFIVHSLVH